MHYIHKTLHHLKSYGSLLLGAFTYSRKASVTFSLPARLTGYLNDIPSGMIVVKFGIEDLHWNVVKIPFRLKSDKNSRHPTLTL